MSWFDDADMDFALRCVLSGVHHGMAEVGETLVAAQAVVDGDPDSWLGSFVRLGHRCRDRAEHAAARRHGYSAWNAALRGANYLYAGTWWAPACTAAGDRRSLWEEHRACWDLAVDHWPSPVQRHLFAHRGRSCPAWWFSSPSAPPRAASAVVLVPGLGTPVSDVCMTGLGGALARGHHVLVLEGPGQGAPLYREGCTLDDGWPDLLDAAISWTAARPEVDPSRVGVLGVGAGALFAARTAARVAAPDRVAPAALVLDPGVVDLARDAATMLDGADQRTRRLSAWSLMDPTGTDDPDEAVAALAAQQITTEELERIECPTLVVTAERAAGFRGQSSTVLDSLRCPHHHVELLAADGAGDDNGICAAQLHDAAVFDWWDATLCGPVPPDGRHHETERGADDGRAG